MLVRTCGIKSKKACGDSNKFSLDLTLPETILLHYCWSCQSEVRVIATILHRVLNLQYSPFFA